MLAVRSTPSSSTSRTEVAPIAIMPTSERYITQIVDVDRACYPMSEADIADSVNYYRAAPAEQLVRKQQLWLTEHAPPGRRLDVWRRLGCAS